jgi:serine protease Do
LLPVKPGCRLPDQQVVSAKVVGVDPAFDLALLKVAVSNLCPVVWSKDLPVTMAGTILAAPSASPTQDRAHLGMGIVSVPTRHLPGPFPKRLERPKIQTQAPSFLGTPTAEGFRLDNRIPMAAANAGIREGDIVVSVGGKPIREQKDVWSIADGLKPGEAVVVRVLRDGKPLEFSVPLGAKPLSSSKDFPTFFEHDMPLALSQCGGPVIDLDGKAVGITAHREQYGCKAIPADCIERLLPELRSGRLVDTWDPPDPLPSPH